MPRKRIPNVPGPASVVLAESNTDEWLRQRQSGIGASEIGALIGANENQTPFDVFRAKVGDVKDISHLPWIEWGHRLEHAVALKTAQEVGLQARWGGGLWRSDIHEFALATPDALATRPRKWDAVGVFECKTSGDDEYWADGGAPPSYIAQVNWQCGILGLERGWLGCLVFNASRDFYVYEHVFDPEWFDEMIQVAEQFWHRNVLAWEPPMHDLAHPRTTELLKELYPRVVQPSIELDEDAQVWVKEYWEAKEAHTKTEKRLEEAKNGLRLAMGGAARGYIGDKLVVSYPEVRPEQISVKDLREKYPEIAAEVTKRSLHRRLTVKRID